MNVVLIVGNVTRDPEMRFTPSGTAVTSFGVAVNQGYGDNKKTEFFNCVAFKKTAELVAEHVHKGNKVGVRGRQQTREWESQDGAKKTRTEIIVDEIEFLTPKQKDEPSDDWGDSPF